MLKNKSKRKPYRGSRAFDKTCRNHGMCAYCTANRLYSNQKRLDVFNTKLTEKGE